MEKVIEPRSLAGLLGVADDKQAEICANSFTLGFLVRSSLGAVLREKDLSLFDIPVPERDDHIRRLAIEKAKEKIQRVPGLKWITEEILQVAFAFGDQLFYGCLA